MSNISTTIFPTTGNTTSNISSTTSEGWSSLSSLPSDNGTQAAALPLSETWTTAASSTGSEAWTTASTSTLPTPTAFLEPNATQTIVSTLPSLIPVANFSSISAVYDTSSDLSSWGSSVVTPGTPSPVSNASSGSNTSSFGDTLTKHPGVLIGVTVAIAGVIFAFIGLLCRCQARTRARRSSEKVHTISGFDFCDLNITDEHLDQPFSEPKKLYAQEALGDMHRLAPVMSMSNRLSGQSAVTFYSDTDSEEHHPDDFAPSHAM